MEQPQLLVGSSNNDAETRKKRDSRAVKAGRRDKKLNDDGASSDHGPEQSKKLRAERTTPAAKSPPAPHHHPENLDPSASNRRNVDPGAVLDEQENGANAGVAGGTDAPVLDLEVALQRVVRMNTNSITKGSDPTQQAEEDESTKEFLSQECWVTFRVGHAGDASTLASWYQISQEQNVKESGKDRNNGEEDTSMEVRLAEGLGDEDTPPSIFALIAEVTFHSNDSKSGSKATMGAAALLSIIREEPRVLNVEWLHVSEDDKLTAVSNLLRRRMWLRLSALALMTSCTTLVASRNIREQEVSDANDNQATATVDQRRSDASSDRL